MDFDAPPLAVEPWPLDQVLDHLTGHIRDTQEIVALIRSKMPDADADEEDRKIGAQIVANEKELWENGEFERIVGGPLGIDGCLLLRIQQYWNHRYFMRNAWHHPLRRFRGPNLAD